MQIKIFFNNFFVTGLFEHGQDLTNRLSVLLLMSVKQRQSDLGPYLSFLPYPEVTINDILFITYIKHMCFYTSSRAFNINSDILYLVFFEYYFKTKLTFCSIFIRILDFFPNFIPPCNFNLIFFYFFFNINKKILIFFYFWSLFWSPPPQPMFHQNKKNNPVVYLY